MARPTGVKVLTAALVLVLAACGTSDTARPAAPASPALDPSGELVATQAVLPDEPSDGPFIDIATTSDDAARAWQRFRLAAEPPQVRDGEALLFAGFGESGSCPFAFDRVEVRGDEVELAQPPTGGSACTADYRPRTVVVAVPVESLPREPFLLQAFPLSTSPVAAPPAGPSWVDSWIGRDPGLTTESRPQTVARGEPVEVVLSTAELPASPGHWPTLLQRWQAQRWLPVEGHRERHLDHPAVDVEQGVVPAASTRRWAVVDTTALPPGWYRVLGRVGLGDAEGSSGVQSVFEVSG